MTTLSVKFVSRKISKVKWRFQSSSIFLTGSWDDKENLLCVWSVPSCSSFPKDSSLITEGTDPQVAAEIPFSGNVTDLVTCTNDLVFASSSNGAVHMYKFSEEKIDKQHSWEKLHSFRQGTPAPITGIAVKGSDVASVGENGKLCVFDFSRFSKVRNIGGSDLCSMSAVSFLRHHEVVIGNTLGYLKTWDLRSGIDKPTNTLMISGDQVGVKAMNTHPTQPHILASGHDDGSICIWDLRQESRPTTRLAGHSAAVTDILFHPVNPVYLFSSSLDGSVWQWNSRVTKPDYRNLSDFDGIQKVGNPWLDCDSKNHRVDILSLFPHNTVCVNSLDINDSTLIWGTDNEAVYLLPGISV